MKTEIEKVLARVGNYIGSRYAAERILFKRKVDLGVVLLLRVNVHGLETVVNELDVLLSAVVLIIRIVEEYVVEYTIADGDGASS